MTPLDAKTREELKRLEAEATPPPWVWCHNPTLTSREAFMAWAGEAWDLTLQADGARESEGIQYVARMLPLDEQQWQGDEHIYVAITGNGPTSIANAKFEAALRNHARALLADSERCEALEKLLWEARELVAEQYALLGNTDQNWAKDWSLRTRAALANKKEPTT